MAVQFAGTEFHIDPSGGSADVPRRRADMTKLGVDCSNHFTNAAKNNIFQCTYLVLIRSTQRSDCLRAGTSRSHYRQQRVRPHSGVLPQQETWALSQWIKWLQPENA